MSVKSSGILLEPDVSLLNQRLLFTKPEDELEDLLLQPAQYDSNIPWTKIKPLPGFCVKLRKNTPDREKVFINICKTDQIPEPEEKSESELMEILSSDEPSAYRVPMSVGEERADVDKSGNPCAVFDIVVNSTFYKKVESSQFFRSFLITATLEALEDKYGLELDRDEFVVLKGRKCKGGMTEQRVQVRSKPLVEMMSSSERSKIKSWATGTDSGARDAKKKPLITEIETKSIGASEKINSNVQAYEPPFIIRWRDDNGKVDKSIMVADIYLKNVILAKDVMVDVGEDRILLKTQKNQYSLDIFLPHLINQDKTTAAFSLDNKVLSLVMPLAS